MTETGKKVLDLLSKAMEQMDEAEQEKLVWFSEGIAAAAKVRNSA